MSPNRFKEEYQIHEKIDLIIGGPPCPGFSNMGRSKIISLVKEGKWNLSEERHQFVDDPRNKLFYEFVKYVKEFQPSMFVFENVKGMRSYKQKNGLHGDPIIDVIKSEFSEIGYICHDDTLNSAKYGVPQFRERIFIVGLRKKTFKEYEFTFPNPTHNERPENINLKRNSKNTTATLSEFFETAETKNGLSSKSNQERHEKRIYVTSMQALMDLPTFDRFVYTLPENKNNYKFGIQEAINQYLAKYKDNEIIFSDTELPEMHEFLNIVRGNIDTLLPGGSKKGEVTCHEPRLMNALGDDEIFPQLKTERNETIMYKDIDPSSSKHETLFRYDPSKFGDKMRRIPWWKPSWTIVAHLAVDGYMFVHPDRNPEITAQHRTITVREAARLQSFPDTFDFSARDEIARTHQFRHVGNAVPPLLGRAIGLELVKCFENLEV